MGRIAKLISTVVVAASVGLGTGATATASEQHIRLDAPAAQDDLDHCGQGYGAASGVRSAIHIMHENATTATTPHTAAKANGRARPDPCAYQAITARKTNAVPKIQYSRLGVDNQPEGPT